MPTRSYLGELPQDSPALDSRGARLWTETPSTGTLYRRPIQPNHQGGGAIPSAPPSVLAWQNTAGGGRIESAAMGLDISAIQKGTRSRERRLNAATEH